MSRLFWIQRICGLEVQPKILIVLFRSSSFRFTSPKRSGTKKNHVSPKARSGFTSAHSPLFKTHAVFIIHWSLPTNFPSFCKTSNNLKYSLQKLKITDADPPYIPPPMWSEHTNDEASSWSWNGRMMLHNKVVLMYGSIFSGTVMRARPLYLESRKYPASIQKKYSDQKMSFFAASGTSKNFKVQAMYNWKLGCHYYKRCHRVGGDDRIWANG